MDIGQVFCPFLDKIGTMDIGQVFCPFLDKIGTMDIVQNLSFNYTSPSFVTYRTYQF
jgi:hypothetical protein